MGRISHDFYESKDYNGYNGVNTALTQSEHFISRIITMLDHPVYVRMPTEDENPYFKRQSAAEVVISVAMMAQQAGWMRLHGFVVLPEALEMVTSPIKQGVAGMVAHLQAETIPLLTVLLTDARFVWGRRYTQIDLTTQRALDARLNMLLLAPVANGITSTAEEFPYSSANPRYKSTVSVYAGFGLKNGSGADSAASALAGQPTNNGGSLVGVLASSPSAEPTAEAGSNGAAAHVNGAAATPAPAAEVVTVESSAPASGSAGAKP